MSIWHEAKKRARNAFVEAVRRSPAGLTTRRDDERVLLRALPSYGSTPVPTGVLLADQIEYFSKEFHLIDPFSTAKLRPAGYELSVGEIYSKGDKIFPLEDRPGKNKIVVEPFEVITVQTLERLNMPEFLIARWNVAVGQAYRGFLWVGAAQVDAGFRGFLTCPIYNLSDQARELTLGESLAVIDFVPTTQPNDNSKKYAKDFTTRKRILFEDYEKIQSALSTQAKMRLDAVEADVSQLRSTVFNSTAIIFAAIGALVTALALFVSNAVPKTVSRFSPSLLIAGSALVVSLLSLVVAFAKTWAKRTAIAVCVLVSIIVFMIWYASFYPPDADIPVLKSPTSQYATPPPR